MTEYVGFALEAYCVPKYSESSSYKHMFYLSSFIRYNESIMYTTPLENIDVLKFWIQRAYQQIG